MAINEEIKVIMIPFGRHWNRKKRRGAKLMEKIANEGNRELGLPWVYCYYKKPSPIRK